MPDMLTGTPYYVSRNEFGGAGYILGSAPLVPPAGHRSPQAHSYKRVVSLFW